MQPFPPLEENYEVAPGDLDLLQVHVYARNGERVTYAPRTLEPLQNRGWTLCNTRNPGVVGATTDPSAADDSEVVTWKGNPRPIPVALFMYRIVKLTENPEKFDDSIKDVVYGDPVRGACGPSQLTDVGRLRSGAVGSALRHIYIDKLKLLPDTLRKDDENLVYFRTAPFHWTRESLYAMIGGLLYPGRPDKNHYRNGFTPKVYVRDGVDDDLAKNMNCPRFAVLETFWRKVAADMFNPSLMGLDQYLSKYVGRAPIRLDGKPPLENIIDHAKFVQAHTDGVVPAEFDNEKVMGVMEKAVIAQTLGGYHNPEYRALGIGRLFTNLQRTMASKVRDPDAEPLRLRLFCVPNPVIGGALVSLGIFGGQWIQFSSSIIFELYKHSPPPALTNRADVEDTGSSRPTASSFYVRTLYQAKPLALPACADRQHHYPGHPELCTFEAFSNVVKTIAPSNYWEQCKDLQSPITFDHGPFATGVIEHGKSQ